MKPWPVGDLPFVFSVQRTPGNAGFPEFLPFTLSANETDGYFIQCHDAAVEAVLDKAYAHGSMLSGLMDEGGIGQRYAEDFLRFICMNQRIPGRHVLDIGCGTGYLLSRLQQLGAHVLGLEPGPHGQDGATRHQVPVIRDCFPSTQVPSQFDLICAFGVLEHIADPDRFLHAVKRQLKDDGLLVLGIPDCEPYFAGGDISLLFHEHWNYFARSSISRLVKRIWGQEPVVERAEFGGTLYVAIRNSKPPTAPVGPGRQQPWMADEFDAFVARAESRIASLWKLLESAWANREVVGIYVPWRAVNVLSVHRAAIPPGRMRFFDDNPLLHNTYYPGFPIRVESRNELISQPPDRLLIMSNTFGRAIEEQLGKAGCTLPVHTWNDLFGT